MSSQIDFNNLLEERNDVIDNLSHQLALTFCTRSDTQSDEDILPWNMEVIGEINGAVQSILEKRGVSTCWPYHEEEIPCYLTDSCKADNCPFKKAEETTP